jgi:hypothetical protein
MRSFTFLYTTDQNGLRVSALAKQATSPEASASSVLFLGDSFTFGWGVNDDETIWKSPFESVWVSYPATGLRSNL